MQLFLQVFLGAYLKNISFNKTVIELLEFSLENLDSEDKKLVKEKREELYS